MIAFAVTLGFVAVGSAMLLNLYPLIAGPNLPDRILALDTLLINTIALLMLVGLRFQDVLYFEAALLIAMLGFIGTTAFCKYILSGDIIE
jgi:multicomponent K+:H+ antiporter subunit F